MEDQDRSGLSGELVDRQARSAALHVDSCPQTGGELLQRVLAGEHEHARARHHATGRGVTVVVDHGEIDLDAELAAAGDLENGKSDGFLVFQPRAQLRACSVWDRIGADARGEGAQIIVVEVAAGCPRERRDRGRYLELAQRTIFTSSTPRGARQPVAAGDLGLRRANRADFGSAHDPARRRARLKPGTVAPGAACRS